ncbi:adenylate/guanylate cyclase domain-containing protein [Candidatus Albibeggiatoa sp. nov. NOAA]|uniref:adenylate/guanylate cyclase domain-containing protein n=1 Tax=Candidatus Albibeggiatoa sp. nov. NOAA TaxID=3162724 RepID=UPI0033016CA0|nr:response regulator [Thiotrichaceae bacterium]
MEAQTSKQRILVVDDATENLDILVSLLQKDYRVIAAKNGEKALDMVAKKVPDLILLDIMMPDMDGYEVCRQLKANQHSQDIPIIFLSALSETLDKVKAFELGGVDYITKPFQSAEVLARVETQLSLRRYMQEVQQYNKLIYKTFGSYLSEDIVKTILETPEEMRLGGAEQTVTVIMSDIRGFTAICERLSAEQVIDMLNQYFDVMTDIILRYKGTIDEFIGDAILAVFGTPIQHPDDAQRAIACALEMQLAMPEVNRRNREAGYPEFEIGIGIHTGDVVVGNMGSQKRMKYGILGHNVNLAQRVESYTAGGQTLISASTYETCQDLLRIDNHLEVIPKGITAPMTIYEVGGIAGDFNIFLPQKCSLELCALSKPITVEFTMLEGKYAQTTTHKAQFIQLGEKSAIMQSEQFCQPWSNLKITVFNHEQQSVNGALYAKVLDQESHIGCRIGFTLVPPELKCFLQAQS